MYALFSFKILYGQASLDILKFFNKIKLFIKYSVCKPTIPTYYNI